MDPLSRAAAEALDAADPLAGFRERFAGAGDDGLLYLDGNSLGRMPRETPAALARVVEEEWGRGLVGSWSSWVGLATAVGDRLAEGVLGDAGQGVRDELGRGHLAAADGGGGLERGQFVQLRAHGRRR